MTRRTHQRGGVFIPALAACFCIGIMVGWWLRSGAPMPAVSQTAPAGRVLLDPAADPGTDPNDSTAGPKDSAAGPKDPPYGPKTRGPREKSSRQPGSRWSRRRPRLRFPQPAPSAICASADCGCR